MQRLSLVLAAVLFVMARGSLQHGRHLLQPPGSCVDIGQAITADDSPCASFVAGPSNADNERIAQESDAAVQAAVNAHARPSPACCVTARPFLENGCACNTRFVNLAGNFGHPKAQIIAGYRLLKASTCLNSTNGGYISDPCGITGPQSI